METFKQYLLLQYKKCAKVFFKTIISLTIVCLVIIGAILLISCGILRSQALAVVNVGVVIPDDNKQAKMVTQIIAQMESVDTLCDFQYLEGQQALVKLQNGELEAVIVLPPDFYADVYSGKNTPATVYFASEPTLKTQLFNQLLEDGVSLLQIAEAGVYASLDTAQIYKEEVKHKNIGDFIAWEYAKHILERHNMFIDYIISPFGDFTASQFYFATLVMCTLLMSGLGYSCLYQKQSKVVEQKLRLYGVGWIQSAAIKIIVITTGLFLVSLLLYLVAYGISMNRKSYFIDFDIYRIIGLIPLCILLAIYIHIIYTIAGEGMQGIVVLCMINLLIILCSGMIIPLCYLPEMINKMSRYLPSTFGYQYCIDNLFGALGIKDWLKAGAIVLMGSGVGGILTWKST